MSDPVVASEYAPEQKRSLSRIGDRHGALSIVRNRFGDLHAQVIGGRRAWAIAPDGRAVSSARREG